MDKWDKVIIGFIIISILFFTTAVYSDQIVHKFKSPSFNGEATSSHYLTIENQEHSRKLTTLEGNLIEYTSDGTTLTLKITEADGTTTEITIPIGTFTF
jgi:hypothetical protein